MSIYKTRQFEKWANKEGLSDFMLSEAMAEIERGLTQIFH
jgi:hypothetical protein